MSQNSVNQYNVHILTKNGGCKIVPTQIPGNITRLCIGYLRATVTDSNGSGVFYTGNPCHRTWVILVQSQSQAQTSQGIIVKTDNFPIVDQIVCFNIDNNNRQLVGDSTDKEFEILPNQFLPNYNLQIYRSSNRNKIELEECKANELETMLRNYFQTHIQSNEISKLLKYLPSKIYVIK